MVIMSLPKTMSDSLIKRLNEACAAFVGVCDRERDCYNLGWCEACWIAAKGGDTDDSEETQGLR